MKNSAQSNDTSSNNMMTHLPPINQNLNKHNQTRPVRKTSSQQSNYSGGGGSINGGNTGGGTGSSAAAESKYYPFIDKNNAFKYIRDHLASKHLEHTNRPNFNIAGIAPIKDDEKVPKYFFYNFLHRLKKSINIIQMSVYRF
jgi:hypothetical protein